MDRDSPPAAPAGEGFGSSRTRRRAPRTGSSCLPAFPRSSARLPLLPLRSPLLLCWSLSCCLTLSVCVFAFGGVCVGLMMQQAAVQPWQPSASSEFLLSEATSALVNI